MRSATELTALWLHHIMARRRLACQKRGTISPFGEALFDFLGRRDLGGRPCGPRDRWRCGPRDADRDVCSARGRLKFNTTPLQTLRAKLQHCIAHRRGGERPYQLPDAGPLDELYFESEDGPVEGWLLGRDLSG